MLKQFRTRLISIFLVAVMLTALFPLSMISASAATASLTASPSGTVSVTYSSPVTYTASTSVFSIPPNSTTSCGSTTYSSQSSNITITNGQASSGFNLTLNYSATIANGGSLSIGGTATTVTSGVISITSTEKTKKISITSGNAENANTTITFSNLVYSNPNAAYDVTVIGADHGTVSVGGHSVASGATYTANSVKNSTGIVISASPESGYSFFGLVDSNNQKQNQDSDGTYHPSSDITLTPVFAQTGVGPVFSVDTYLYTDFNSAATKSASLSKPMIPVQDCTLPSGNYTVPNKATLLVPFDAGGTVYTSEPVVLYNTYTTPTAFRTLEMADGASITVASGGAICVNSQLSSKGQLGGTNGCPTGPDGRINMHTGSKITVNSGANLYTWGYIYGSGEVEALNGATVYEAFQVKDWRGGTATSNVYDYAFIFSQYYIQNIEVPLKLNSGATEKLYSSVNASSSAYPISATFIGSGTSSSGTGMFRLTGNGTYLIKDYIENTDKIEYKMYGSACIMPLVISGVPMVGTVSTDDFRLPLNSNMTISVQSGTTQIAQNLELLPGVEIKVAANATAQVNSGKNIYVFDASEWGNFTGSAKLYPVGYSVANGTTTKRTADGLDDAKIDIDGTFNISGKLYTSQTGADITSFNGTENFKFLTAPPNDPTTIYEMANNSTKTGVTFYPPLMHNGDGSYSATAGTGTSTWKYDKPGEHWYRFTVDFVYGGQVIERGYFCENGDTVTYDASWLTNLGASASNGTATLSGTDINVTGVTADSTVTLTGTPAEYIPTFVLNEKQYGLYQLYTGNTISKTTTIDDKTYYIVDQAASALAVGTSYVQPTGASMGIYVQVFHNSITWNMSGLSATSGNPYRGIVPVGETVGQPVYIYGFYSGVVAYNSYTDAYYSTLVDAFAATPTDRNATIRLVADCGSFENELSTSLYTVYSAQNIILDLNGHKAVGHVQNEGIFTLELGGGTLDYRTGTTAAAAAYAGTAAIINIGTMTVQDSVGGGVIKTDAISNSSTLASYSAVVYNKTGASFTMTGGTLQYAQASANNYAAVLLNYGTVSISDSTLTGVRGYGIYNTSAGTVSLLQDSTVSLTHASAAYAVYNNAGKITKISGSELSTLNTVVLYNYNNGKITTLENTSMTITTPTTKNIYAVWNYGGTITTMDGCTITGNSGINNRNQRNSTAITAGYALAYKGTIGTISNSTVTVGQYAIYNGGTINTMTGSTFTAAPASAQVPWPSGTAALNGNSVHCYTIYNSNLWWYDSAVWKRTDTTVTNNGTSMLQRRINEYKTDDAYMPTIGTITDCTITANNTSTSSSYGYYALQNLGVINSIEGNTEITAKKHDSNAKSVYGYYALRNESGGKIGSIGSGVTINAYNYALANLGARYDTTETTYSTTYLESGALKSGGLATDYDYTYADVSYIGSTAATISSTSQYAVLNYSKIGSITGTVSGNYNVIVNAGAATTTSGIEGTTANVRAIEHRYFENDDSSATANEYRRYFEYTRNTTDGCYIGSIDATVTATGAGYQAISNQGYIGTIAGTVSTPTGKATSSSTYYPLIYNGDQRQATLKQTEDYYVESNDYGATKYLREYTYAVPTIDTISCTATNPQDYTIRNLGTINTLNGNISGKTITVANEASGPFLTRKTITYYSSATRLAATKASSEVNYEFTKDQAKINNISGATITTTGTTNALRNYGYVGAIQNSTITSTTTGTILNNSSSITEYTSNRLEVLTGCTPSASACALAYDQTQTIDENEVRAVATIDTIGAGNTIQGTYYAIQNLGHINTIDSGTGTPTQIIATGSGAAVYNYQGTYDSRINTDAELTNATGTLTNHYVYNYVPAYIGTIKHTYIQSARNVLINGDGNANYKLVKIEELGEGAEFYNTGKYHVISNNGSNAQIEKISGGIYRAKTAGAYYAVYNAGTAYPILISGGYFRSGTTGTATGRSQAVYKCDDTAYITYPTGMALSSATNTRTPSGAVNANVNVSGYYFVADQYTVDFNILGHGTAPDSQTIESGQKATQPTTPAAESTVTEGTAKYRFDGWYTDDTFTTAFNFNTAITQSTTVYAKWTRVYTVTWNDSDGNLIDTTEVAEGTVPTHADPSKAADAQYTYNFAGWSTNGTDVVSLSPVTADITYQAVFSHTPNTYTVTWVDGNGTTIETDANVPYGDPISYDGATPTKTATAQYTYTFSGSWSDGTNVYTAANLPTVSGNVTYTAQFDGTVNSYIVTFDKNGRGTAPASQTVEYGGKPTKPSDLTATGYTFGGWYKESGCTNAWDFDTDTVTGDTTLYAKWTIKSYYAYYYNRYYDSTGAIPAPSSSTYAAARKTMKYSSSESRATLTSPTTSLVSGTLDYKYTYSEFVGWYVTTYSSSTKKFTPVYDTAQSAVTADQITPEFLSQKAEENKFTAPGGKIKVTSNRYIFAVYRISSTKEHTVTMYDATDSNAPITEGTTAYSDVNTAVEYGSRASVPTKNNTDQYTYSCIGWSTGTEYDAAADKTVPAHTASEQLNIVYDAQTYYFYYSSVLNKYTVTWKNGNTTIETDENIDYGTAPSYDGATPTKADDAQNTYIFAGWKSSVDDQVYTAANLPLVSANVTYTAQFSPTKRSYTVTWSVDGNTTTESLEYGTVPTHDDPTKAADAQYTYTFTGWSDGTTTYNKGTELPSVTGAVTYTAQFDSTLRSYTVTWVLGDSIETSSVAYGDVPTPPADVQDYTNGIYSYTFRGWDKEFTAVAGDQTYTALYDVAKTGDFEFFKGITLTLNGSIGLNFFIDLPAENANPADYTFDISFYKEDEQITGVSLSEASLTTVEGNNYYKISFPVDAPEMTDEVTATLYYKGIQVDSSVHKSSDYAAKTVPGNTDTGLVDGAYYVVGTIMGKDCWQENVNLQYKMTQNPNNLSEYMLENIELQKGDKIKVIQYHEGSPLGWFPDGSDNEYIVGDYYGTQGCETGTFTVYVNPANDNSTNTDWDGRSGKQIYVQPKTDSASLLPSLLRAMQNYGSKAQVYFRHNTTDVSDSADYIKSPNSFGAVTNDMINAKLGTTQARDTSSAAYRNTFSSHGLTYAGHTLVLNSNTKLRFYFTVSAGFDLESFNNNTSFTVSGYNKDNVLTTAEWGNQNHTMIYLEVDNIEAANLDSVYTLSDGESSMDYSPLDYVRLMLNQSNESLKNLGQSLYWYNYYADLYFAAVANEQH